MGLEPFLVKLSIEFSMSNLFEALIIFIEKDTDMDELIADRPLTWVMAGPNSDQKQ